MVQIDGILCKNEHVRIHTRTPKNTTLLHHPSTHSDNDTDQKHHKSLHSRTHLDQYRNCLFCLSRISVCALLNLCWSGSWQLLVVAGLGDSGERRVVGQDGGVRSPKNVVGQAAVFVNVLLQSSEETRRHVMSVGAHGV